MNDLPSPYAAWTEAFASAGEAQSQARAAFARLLRRLGRPASALEYSVKVSGGERHADRVNLWVDSPTAEDLERALELLREIRAGIAPLELTLVHELLAGAADGQTAQLIVGTDLRSRLGDCRMKLWVITTAPRKTASLYARHGFDHLLGGVAPTQLLAGVDLGFDGSTRIKTYPLLRLGGEAGEASRRALERVLGGRALALLSRCSRVHLSRHDASSELVLHCRPRDGEAFFAALLPSPAAVVTHRSCTAMGLRLTILSAGAGTLEAGELSDMNLYYRTAGTPPTARRAEGS